MDTFVGVLACVLFGIMLFGLVSPIGDKEEVKIYMDPENNVVCYYTRRNMQCFTYTDEGTHLQLNG